MKYFLIWVLRIIFRFDLNEFFYDFMDSTFFWYEFVFFLHNLEEKRENVRYLFSENGKRKEHRAFFLLMRWRYVNIASLSSYRSTVFIERFLSRGLLKSFSAQTGKRVSDILSRSHWVLFWPFLPQWTSQASHLWQFLSANYSMGPM